MNEEAEKEMINIVNRDVNELSIRVTAAETMRALQSLPLEQDTRKAVNVLARILANLTTEEEA